MFDKFFLFEMKAHLNVFGRLGRVIVCLTAIWGFFAHLTSTAQHQTENLITSDTALIIDRINAAQKMLFVTTLKTNQAAFKDLQDAYLQSEKISFHRGSINAGIGMAYNFFYLEQYDTTLAILNKILSVAEREGIPNSIASVKIFRGSVYTNIGLYDKAMQDYFDALDKLDTNSIEAQLHVNINIASLLLRMKNVTEAFEYLNKVEPKLADGKYLFLKAFFYLNKGECYANLENRNLSLSDHYIKKAIEIAKQNGYTVLTEEGIVLLAKNEYYKANYKSSLNYLHQSEKLGTSSTQSQTAQLVLKAKCYLKLYQFDKAKRIMKIAENNAIGKAPFLLPEIYEALTELYKRTYDYRQALHYAELYKKENENLVGDATRAKVNTLQLLYETEKRDRNIKEKELLIEKQEKTINRKNTITYGVAGGCIMLLSVAVGLYKYRQAALRRQNQLAIWQATIKAGENERTRMAKYLHDSVAGTLSTISTWLSKIQINEPLLQSNSGYQEIQKLLHSCTGEIRNSAHHLMPELLVHYGLIEAVRIYCENIEEASALKIDFQHLGNWEEVESELAIIIYRIIQELTQNIVKHAKAKNVIVQLSYNDSWLLITVEDDGIGFDKSDENMMHGMGLISVRQSVGYLNGEMKIESFSDKGTSVFIEINFGKRK